MQEKPKIQLVSTRGRVFEGYVTKKFPTRVVIEYERTIFIPKYERYQKKKSRIHARLLGNIEVDVGDYIKVQECRPLSKIIHHIVIEKVNINSIKKVLTTFPPKKYLKFDQNQDFEHYGEDLYFVVGMLKLGFPVGNDKFATNFCTHTSYINNTFCVHKLNFYNKKDAQRFFNYCEIYKKFLKIEPI